MSTSAAAAAVAVALSWLSGLMETDNDSFRKRIISKGTMKKLRRLYSIHITTGVYSFRVLFYSNIQGFQCLFFFFYYDYQFLPNFKNA